MHNANANPKQTLFKIKSTAYNKATPTTAPPIMTIASRPSLTTPAAPVAVLEADEPEAAAVGVREEVLKAVPFPTTDVSITRPPAAVPVPAAAPATELNVALTVVVGTTTLDDSVLNFPLALADALATDFVEEEYAEAMLVQLPILAVVAWVDVAESVAMAI